MYKIGCPIKRINNPSWCICKVKCPRDRWCFFSNKLPWVSNIQATIAALQTRNLRMKPFTLWSGKLFERYWKTKLSQALSVSVTRSTCIMSLIKGIGNFSKKTKKRLFFFQGKPYIRNSSSCTRKHWNYWTKSSAGDSHYVATIV